MKTALLTSILAIIALSNSCGAAEAPKLSISGRMDVQAGFLKEKTPYQNTNPYDNAQGQNLHKSAIVNDTVINLQADGKINKDCTYGGSISLNSDTSNSNADESTVARTTMIYAQHKKIGRIEAGAMMGTVGVFGNKLSYFNIGSMGATGYVTVWYHNTSYRTAQAFTTNPILKNIMNNVFTGSDKGRPPQTRSLEFLVYDDLPSDYISKYYLSANKINLYTKPIPELTIGLTYIPDFDTIGTVANRAPRNGGPIDDRKAQYPASLKNIWSGGLNYEKQLNKDWLLSAVLLGEIGQAKWSGVRGLKAYKTGVKAGYKNYQVNATYGSWGKTLTFKQPNAGTKQGSQFWTLGFAQYINKFGYSVTYLNTRKAGGIEVLTQKLNNDIGMPLIPLNTFSDPAYNKHQNIALDLEYKLAPGFVPYAALSFFKFKESTGSKDNGYLALIGTRLVF